MADTVSLQITNWQSMPNYSELEKVVLEYWSESQAFAESIRRRPQDKQYVFYDGPPFATGLPHYGHLLASTIKDVVPRYWTMKGYRVERVWGWDCHGLPIENLLEQELNLQGGKKGIEAYGIAQFNDACRAAILRFDKEWEQIIQRVGRWVDFQHSYKTMDTPFMESVWWAFAELYKKGLVYEGRKVVLYCPRCATPLSNFEIAMDNSYKDVEDNSVYVLFKRTGTDKEFFVAWTTTPWTLIGNVGLAVHPEATYVQIQLADGRLVWMAQDLQEKVLGLAGLTGTVVQTKIGSELVGATYEPLYTYMPTEEKVAYRVVAAPFVSLEDGTGIVHTAAIYGEDDYALAQQEKLPCVPTLDEQGKFFDFVTPLAGVFYKKSEGWIVDDLYQRGLVWNQGKIRHSYPFCYRCSTPLYYSAVPAWFVNVQQLKPQMKQANEAIQWFPGHLKHGRFGNGLDTAPDWNISRSRYWGTPMPIWKGEVTGKLRVINSIPELKTWAVEPEHVAKLTDLHRQYVDNLEVWVDDARQEKGKRIPEVFDCWVESGSMPFASQHYPFEHKQQFEARFPAQFISEYIAQTRAWFYTLHVLSVGLFNKPSFTNAVTTGTILAADGTKMSKSKKNYPDPMLIVSKYGADALRLYLMSSPVMRGENLNFEEKGVEEIKRKTLNLWWNVLAFFKLYSKNDQKIDKKTNSEHILDHWILALLNDTVHEYEARMQNYDVVSASRLLISFVQELSTWYVRLSRERFRNEDVGAICTLEYVLRTLSLLFAPFTPFFAEVCWQNLGNTDSVHWQLLPSEQEKVNKTLLEQMALAQQVTAALTAARKDKQLAIKQPLAFAKLEINGQTVFSEDIIRVIQQETNIEKIVVITNTKLPTEVQLIELDTTITPELAAKRELREAVRKVQQLRREAGVPFGAVVDVVLPSWPRTLEAELKQKVLARTLIQGAEARLTIVTE